MTLICEKAKGENIEEVTAKLFTQSFRDAVGPESAIAIDISSEWRYLEHKGIVHAVLGETLGGGYGIAHDDKLLEIYERVDEKLKELAAKIDATHVFGIVYEHIVSKDPCETSGYMIHTMIAHGDAYGPK